MGLIPFSHAAREYLDRLRSHAGDDLDERRGVTAGDEEAEGASERSDDEGGGPLTHRERLSKLLRLDAAQVGITSFSLIRCNLHNWRLVTPLLSQWETQLHATGFDEPQQYGRLLPPHFARLSVCGQLRASSRKARRILHEKLRRQQALYRTHAAAQTKGCGKR
jgi:hypothetical protein